MAAGGRQPSGGPKQGKNRTHLDLRTTDVDAEVERVLALGRTGPTWADRRRGVLVLADPEGNEFCILR